MKVLPSAALYYMGGDPLGLAETRAQKSYAEIDALLRALLGDKFVLWGMVNDCSSLMFRLHSTPYNTCVNVAYVPEARRWAVSAVDTSEGARALMERVLPGKVGTVGTENPDDKFRAVYWLMSRQQAVDVVLKIAAISAEYLTERGEL